MHDHNKGHSHDHHDCCGHDHAHDHKHDHKHSHDHSHEHDHKHSHDHSHEHDHSCCDHDHGHKHLSAHECSAMVNQARACTDHLQATELLLQAGAGFAHLGDGTGTAAVAGLLGERTASGIKLNAVQSAQLNAVKALALALTQAPAKDQLTASVAELENFSGNERIHVEQLLGDVRKALANLRNSGLKSLLSKFKF